MFLQAWNEWIRNKTRHEFVGENDNQVVNTQHHCWSHLAQGIKKEAVQVQIWKANGPYVVKLLAVGMNTQLCRLPESIFCHPWWIFPPESTSNRGVLHPSRTRADDGEQNHSVHDTTESPRARYGWVIVGWCVVVRLDCVQTHRVMVKGDLLPPSWFVFPSTGTNNIKTFWISFSNKMAPLSS